MWVLHRDGRWFRDPDDFRPERWTDGLLDRLPRMAYMPFGGGPRICIGMWFAMLEAVLCLATIARRLDLEATAPTGPAIEVVPSVTLRPRLPVRLRVARR